MAAMYRTEAFRGPLMRVSYAWQLFKLRDAKSDYKPKYGCTLIMPKSGDWSAIRNAIKEVLEGQWGVKGAEKFKAGLIRSPILAGDGKEARSKETGDLHPGMGADVNFIRVQSGPDRKPRVFDAAMKRCSVVKPGSPYTLLEEEDCPSGSWGYPVLNAFAWNNPQNGDGISFGIDMFQITKVATGDEILGGGGESNPDKFFEKIATDDNDDGDKPGSAEDLFA